MPARATWRTSATRWRRFRRSRRKSPAAKVRCCGNWKRNSICAPNCGRGWKRRSSTIARCRAATAASSGRAFMPSWMSLRELAAGGKQWIARYQAEEVAAHGHRQSEGRLQQGVRLLHRNHEHARPQDSGELHPQADGEERRALHHAGAERIRRKGAHGRREVEGIGIRAVRRAARIASLRKCARLQATAGGAGAARRAGGAGRSGPVAELLPADARRRAGADDRRRPASGARCA